MTSRQWDALRQCVSGILTDDEVVHDAASITFGQREGVPVAYYSAPGGCGWLHLVEDRTATAELRDRLRCEMGRLAALYRDNIPADEALKILDME